MQLIKNHKILTSFNALALLLIIVGTSTDFTVPESGTSISGGIAAWGGLLLIIMLFIDGGVAMRRNKLAQNNNRGVNTPIQTSQQLKLNKLKGASIITGALLGLVATCLLLANQGPDAGLLFIPIAAVFAPLGAFILITIVKIGFGDKSQKSNALKWFIIVALLIAAYLGYSYYQDKYSQKYCNGQPVEQYQGPLPSYCQNQ